MHKSHQIKDTHVLFDFDGVFVDSLGFHVRQMNEIFGIHVTEEIMRHIHQGSFHSEAPAELLAVDWKKYEETIRETLPGIAPNEGLHEILEYLAQNRALHIVSSAGTSVIDRYLAHHGLSDHFETVLGWDADPSKPRKFARLAEERRFLLPNAAFITDTLGDLKEAEISGIGTRIAVDFGYHDRATLEKGNPHHIISHLSELKIILS